MTTPPENPTGVPPAQPAFDREAWVLQSREALQTNRPLAPAQKLDQFRGIIRDRSLEDLQRLAQEIVSTNILQLSDLEERELAVRVRALLGPERLRQLLESRDINQRLQILENRAELLQLVNRHLQPGVTEQVAGTFEGFYNRVVNSPTAVGDFVRRQGQVLETMGPNRRTAFVNQIKKGFFLAMEFPSMVSNFLPIPNIPMMERFSHRFRERRAMIEGEERIFRAINRLKTQNNPPLPNIEFAGFDPAAFNAFKQKHLPKDAQGNVTSEEFTDAVRTAVLRDIEQSVAAFVAIARDPARGGNAQRGQASGAANTIRIEMANLVNPNAVVEQRNQQATAEVTSRIINGIPRVPAAGQQPEVAARPSAWGQGVVRAVEFGTTYAFTRADGKLTIPRAAVNENGEPVDDQSRLLRDTIARLPNTVTKVSVAPAGQPLVVGAEVQIPLNRAETPEQIQRLVALTQGNPRLSILRSGQSQIMRGQFRYIGENGRGVIEWQDGAVFAADIESFLATPRVLEDAVPNDEWRRSAVNPGTWEKIPR